MLCLNYILYPNQCLFLVVLRREIPFLREILNGCLFFWDAYGKSYNLSLTVIWVTYDWCVKQMTERDNLTDPEKSKEYAQTMSTSANELEILRMELQALMVKFGLRALKLYQTGTPEPLLPSQMTYLIKYELTNAIADLQEAKNIKAIINATKEEWKTQQQE
jgi:tRNA C32,U32 (ribose-2'-O)-methylase TrmJ